MRKTLHHRLQEERENPLRSPEPEENREDHHEDLHDMELEWKRSAPKPLLNSVLGENLEDLHWKKEFQQSAQPQTLLSPKEQSGP